MDISVKVDFKVFKWKEEIAGSQRWVRMTDNAPRRNWSRLAAAATDVKAAVEDAVFWNCVFDWADTFYDWRRINAPKPEKND